MDRMLKMSIYLLEAEVMSAEEPRTLPSPRLMFLFCSVPYPKAGTMA
jgi:hypothetical protein